MNDGHPMNVPHMRNHRVAMAPCSGINKAGGPCGAHPLKGTDHCAAHPISPDSARFGSPEQAREAAKSAGRPRLPKPTDVARRLIEENVAVVLRPHFRALGHDVEVDDQGVHLVPVEGGGAKLHGTSKDGYVRVSDHDDLGAQMTASEKLQDRVWGRPKQQTEISGPDGGPLEVVPIAPDAERAAAIAKLLRDTGAI